MPLLHWLTRDQDILAATQTPYRLLEQVPEHSHGDPNTGNMLVHGDNLAALKALLPYFAGKVKCIFIDPPYNTRSAFEHYDDNLEHAKWLALMYPRLELLHSLLANEGSIWVTIDDNEAHYLKVIMDEVFERKNFVGNIVWQKRYSRENRTAIGNAHDNVLTYAKVNGAFTAIRNKLPLGEKQTKIYKNPNNDPRGKWRAVSLSAQGFRPNQMYVITGPTGKKHKPPAGSCWKVVEAKYHELVADDLIYFGKDGNAVPSRIQFLNAIDGIVPWSWWPHEETGHNDEAKREVQVLFGADNAFDTPKPERLIHRILTIATNPGDLVLDSFLGSGTTAAVAHKMGRRYIGIEMGDHAMSHCVPRLHKVIEGEQGGISEAVEWKGGGGFRFYKLGVPVFDEHGHISTGIHFALLAAHLWFVSTGIPYKGSATSPFLGEHEGVGYYLLFNGILGDLSADGGNVLTGRILANLPNHDGQKVIFGESCRFSAERLLAERIIFRQIPYEIKAR
jgi:adenine-specific DNA-methyltransferase